MKIITMKNSNEAAAIAADAVAAQIKKKPNSVLGFATGSSPIETYKKLIQMYNDGRVDFAGVTCFNLDEYCGLGRDNYQSYYQFMKQNLFNHVNVNKKNINIPNGKAKNLLKECKDYEKKIAAAGGIDLQILGIGHNGHIGFNEPGALFHSLTNVVELSKSTIEANERFFSNVNEVPKFAITMGIGTIMAARKIILLAGPNKREIIEKLRQDVVSPQVPASILNYHPDCTVLFAKE